jgi:hypothetical protein
MNESINAAPNLVRGLVDFKNIAGGCWHGHSPPYGLPRVLDGSIEYFSKVFAALEFRLPSLGSNRSLFFGGGWFTPIISN